MDDLLLLPILILAMYVFSLMHGILDLNNNRRFSNPITTYSIIKLSKSFLGSFDPGLSPEDIFLLVNHISSLSISQIRFKPLN